MGLFSLSEQIRRYFHFPNKQSVNITCWKKRRLHFEPIFKRIKVLTYFSIQFFFGGKTRRCKIWTFCLILNFKNWVVKLNAVNGASSSERELRKCETSQFFLLFLFKVLWKTQIEYFHVYVFGKSILINYFS